MKDRNNTFDVLMFLLGLIAGHILVYVLLIHIVLEKGFYEGNEKWFNDSTYSTEDSTGGKAD